MPNEKVVEVATTPPGAEVVLDGKRVGKTPFTIHKLDLSKSHALEVKRAGFVSQTRSISATDTFESKGDKDVLAVAMTLEAEPKAVAAEKPAAATPVVAKPSRPVHKQPAVKKPIEEKPAEAATPRSRPRRSRAEKPAATEKPAADKPAETAAREARDGQAGGGQAGGGQAGGDERQAVGRHQGAELDEAEQAPRGRRRQAGGAAGRATPHSVILCYDAPDAARPALPINDDGVGVREREGARARDGGSGGRGPRGSDGRGSGAGAAAAATFVPSDIPRIDVHTHIEAGALPKAVALLGAHRHRAHREPLGRLARRRWSRGDARGGRARRAHDGVRQPGLSRGQKRARLRRAHGGEDQAGATRSARAA